MIKIYEKLAEVEKNAKTFLVNFQASFRLLDFQSSVDVI